MRKSIGILTFHFTYNYGAALQSYALCEHLNGHNVKCINYLEPNRYSHYNKYIFLKDNQLVIEYKKFLKNYFIKHNRSKRKKFDKFVFNRIPITEERYQSFSDLSKIENDYDILICGSDQIWNPLFTGGKIDKSYFLSFSKKSIKISYASSAGSYQFSNSELNILKVLLNNFQYVSVRERYLKKQLSAIYENNIHTVLDPTLLLYKDDWLKIQSKLNLNFDFILLYTFDNCQASISAARSMADKLKCRLLSIKFNLKKDFRIDQELTGIGPEEFIWLFNKAKFVVTNSYHGTIFSVIFKKNFFSVWKSNNPYRVLNFLSTIDLSNRLIKKPDEIERKQIEINFDRTIELLEIEIKKSRNFLLTAING